MRVILFLLASFILCSCDPKRGDSIPYSEEERLADEILDIAAKKLRSEKGLVLCGTGGGMLGRVRMLALSFDYRHPVTIAEGRELVVSAVETLLAEVNSHESIRPYLKNYPFRPTNVEVRIFLRNADGSKFSQKGLCSISAFDGMVIYRTHALNEQLETVHEESYEKELRLRYAI